MMSLDSPKGTDRLNIGLPNIVGTKSCAKNWSETIDQTIKGCVYCNTVCPVYQNQLHNLYYDNIWIGDKTAQLSLLDI